MPKIRIARRRSTCSDCKAFDPTALSACVLGYSTETFVAGVFQNVVIVRPAETCPKPKTTPKFFECLKERDNHA